MTTRILFVCLGNICRSPTGEVVFASIAREAGLDVQVDSAGTGDWHIGNPPHGPAIRAAAVRGYDLSKLRARQMDQRDFEDFDLILAMDRSNLERIEAVRPAGNATPVSLFLEFAEMTGLRDVPDPYFTDDFEGVLGLIEAASRGLADQLRQNVSAVAPKFL